MGHYWFLWGSVEGKFSELRAGLREVASCLWSKGLEPA